MTDDTNPIALLLAQLSGDVREQRTEINSTNKLMEVQFKNLNDTLLQAREADRAAHAALQKEIDHGRAAHKQSMDGVAILLKDKADKREVEELAKLVDLKAAKEAHEALVRRHEEHAKKTDERMEKLDEYLDERPVIRKEMEKEIDEKLGKKLDANDWRVWVVGGFMSLLLLGVGKQYVDLLWHPRDKPAVVQNQIAVQQPRVAP